MTADKARFRFPKKERLSSKKLIEELFSKGSSFSFHPFKVLYMVNPEPASAHQVLISVPRKKFKNAVQRNLIRRRIRESYRLNNSIIGMGHEATIPYIIAYIYNSKEVLSSQVISEKLKSSLERLILKWKA